MQKLVDRGRATVVTILWLQLMLALGVILLCVAFMQFEAAGRRLLTLVCEIGLMVSLYRGHRLGQWLYVFGFAAGTILVALLWTGAVRGLPAVLAVALIAYFVWAAWAIGFSPSVGAFLQYQRGELELVEDDLAGDETAESNGDLSAARSCGQCGGKVPANYAWCPLCGATSALDHA